jgi:hypothetical protein
LLDNKFSSVLLPAGVGIDISPAGNLATMGEATNQGDVPLSYYDASNRTIHRTTAYQYYSPGSLTRFGSKLLSGEFLRDSDYSVFGELRSGSLPILGDVMDSDGAYVYTYAETSGSSPIASIRIFDARVSSPVLPELNSIVLPDYPGVVRMRVSLDNKTLFIIGNEKFIVQPLL